MPILKVRPVFRKRVWERCMECERRIYEGDGCVELYGMAFARDPSQTGYLCVQCAIFSRDPKDGERIRKAGDQAVRMAYPILRVVGSSESKGGEN